MEELGQSAQDDGRLRYAHERIQNLLHEPVLLDQRGRTLVEGLATLAAATILFAHAPAPIADAFIATRLGGRMRQTYGQGLERADTRAIVTRASPNQV